MGCSAGRVFLVALLVLHQPATTAVIVVDGSCSLADAITAANTDSAVGACSAGSGADELQLTTDVILASPLPEISSEVTLEGNNFTVARGGGTPAFGIFSVLNGSFALLNATVGGGRALNGGGIYASDNSRVEISNATLTGNNAARDGGAVHIGYGTYLAVTDSTLSNNGADSWGGAINSERYAQTEVVITGSSLLDNSANKGGGISIRSEGLATVTNSTLSGNSAGLAGGGIYGSFGTVVTVTNSRLLGNSSEAFGGGILNNGDLAVFTSTLSGNYAAQGGAIYSAFDVASVTNSTLSGNSAGTRGGGIYNGLDGATTVAHSTVSGNSALIEGGGIFDLGSGDITLVGSIVAYSAGGGNCSGPGVLDGGGNFDDDGSCPGAFPVTAGVDFDTALADNGGPTQTHALLPGSVAIDAAGACGLVTDQRGFPRDDGLCDSGSVELGAETVGGSVTGIRALEVRCINATTSQSLRFPLSGETTWDCEAQGLTVSPGDIVRQLVFGRALNGAGGSVVGMASSGGSCNNLTTGQSVSVPAASASWDCVAEGLIVNSGDRIDQRVSGTVP
jgi:hypothetical protein